MKMIKMRIEFLGFYDDFIGRWYGMDGELGIKFWNWWQDR